MTHDDEREHIARMAAVLDTAGEALSRPHLPHPTPQHVALRIMDAMRHAGLLSWAATEAVRAGCARAAAEHAAAQKEAR